MATTHLGILGGTFDPIHTGHLILAETIREEAGLDGICFLPAWIPPHKQDAERVSAAHRQEMVRFAIQDNPRFSLQDLELRQQGISYTIHTLRSLAEEYGPHTELYFITGADAIMEIESWYLFKELLDEFPFLVGARPGFENDALHLQINKLTERYGARIRLITMPRIEISSTDIRNRVTIGKSIRYLVPELVEHYIDENQLYVVK